MPRDLPLFSSSIKITRTSVKIATAQAPWNLGNEKKKKGYDNINSNVKEN